MIWKCPNCDAPLKKQINTERLCCLNNHSFDFAKQGYVNLLLDNHKRTQNPGDNDEMLAARSRFLQAGYYDQLVNSLADLIPNNATLIDLGCGEGYYLQQLLNLKKPNTLTAAAIDIAKTGIRKAALTYKKNGHKVQTAVGNTFRIPTLDASFEIALSIFSPYCSLEVARILKNEGVFIRVGPSVRHLHEIKTHLYDKPTEHTDMPPPESFILEKSQRVTFTQKLSGKIIIEDLIPMTPLHWQGSITSKTVIASQEELQVTFDFIIEVFKPIKPSFNSIAMS